MRIFLILFLATLSLNLFAKTKKGEKKLFKTVFPQMQSLKEIKVKDSISDEPINTTIKEVIGPRGRIGFARNIVTTTGCDSACLPLSYSAFYDKNAGFIKILSSSGLTKINHAPFTQEDYSTLGLILSLNPENFRTVSHPKEMTDAISGETLKLFENSVVKGAAYSTLRINLYNQNTIKELKAYLKKSGK